MVIVCWLGITDCQVFAPTPPHLCQGRTCGSLYRGPMTLQSLYSCLQRWWAWEHSFFKWYILPSSEVLPVYERTQPHWVYLCRCLPACINYLYKMWVFWCSSMEQPSCCKTNWSSLQHPLQSSAGLNYVPGHYLAASTAMYCWGYWEKIVQGSVSNWSEEKILWCFSLTCTEQRC